MSVDFRREELVDFLLSKYNISSCLPITVSMYIVDLYVSFLERVGIEPPVTDSRIAEVFADNNLEYHKTIMGILEDFEAFFDKLGLVKPTEGRDLQREIDSPLLVNIIEQSSMRRWRR